MDNMKIYEAVRNAPENALKSIEAGRLKGKSDINPIWRIRTLTEQFGPCGIGWKYVIKRQWLEPGASGEIAAFVEIDLFFKHDEVWSEAIPGTGGSGFVQKERNGLYTNDECFKMALTDAISVACKALGFAANVYWEKDRSKYDNPAEPEKTYCCAGCGKEFRGVRVKDGKTYTAQEVYTESMKKYGGQALCKSCGEKFLAGKA